LKNFHIYESIKKIRNIINKVHLKNLDLESFYGCRDEWRTPYSLQSYLYKEYIISEDYYFFPGFLLHIGLDQAKITNRNYIFEAGDSIKNIDFLFLNFRFVVDNMVNNSTPIKYH
jgi:hypothetical protein